MSAASYRFAEFLVDVPGMRLLHAGAPLELEPKALRALIHLVEHPRRLVSKQELLDAVWDGASVTDNSLTRVIAQIRKALGDDAHAARFVETAHVLGYRFIAEVEEVTESAGEPSVAVLPFLDLSPEHDQEYLCDGLAEELTNVLAQLAELRVAARTSSFALKGRAGNVRDLGRRLGVGAVLEGSVRRDGDHLRVTVQLISVADGYHLWSERFDRTAGDLFALEDEIALGVAERLKVELATQRDWPSARRHVPVPEAYRLYLQGRYYFNRRAPEDVRRALELFARASASDPAWGLPHLGSAEIFEVLGLWGFLPPDQACPRAKAAALRALELDDTLLAAHAILADVLFLHERDWRGAFAHLERARGALPAGGHGRFVLAMFALATGKTEDAVRLAERHVESDPASPLAHEQAAAVLVGVGRIERAAELLEKALALDPALPLALFWLGFCRSVQGRHAEAVERLSAAADRGLAGAHLFLPAALVRAGRGAEARALVERLERDAATRYVSPVERLCAWAALDERERCRALFADAERERCPPFAIFTFAPGFLALAPDWLRDAFARRRVDSMNEIRRATADLA